MDRAPRVGDRVRVPFGFDEVEGTVIDVNGKGDFAWIMVEVFLDGSAEPTRLTFRPRDIQPAQAA